ncbi:MAG: choice-of-anchor tandem repeat GloVer-containing protein [Thermoanaerobaculia bacterium]
MTLRNRLLFVAFAVVAFGVAASLRAGSPGTIFAFGVSSTGSGSMSELVADPAGNLYGVTSRARTGAGVIFEISSAGNFSVLHEFGTALNDGLSPAGALVFLSGNLYGTTSAGGDSARGSIFSLSPDGADYHVLHSFGYRQNDGESPQAGLSLFEGKLWGTTSAGGRGGKGTIFSLNPAGDGYAVVFSFDSASGLGTQPAVSLAFAAGRCLGVTSQGSEHGDGAIFSVLPDGSQATLLHAFDRTSTANGYFPDGPLTLSNGLLYGVTDGGGVYGPGIAYAIRPDGSDFRIVHNFGSDQHADGSEPAGALLAAGGRIFGITAFGGANDLGVAYSLEDGGAFTILHSFGSEAADGAVPHAGFVLANGALFGTTPGGGENANGTAFAINPDGGGYRRIFSFGRTSPDGWYPAAGVIDVGGKLFGSTVGGGISPGSGVLYSVNTDGSGEQILHEFAFDAGDGIFPGNLVAGSDGTLYGGTGQGGAFNFGTVFRINANGSGYETLHSFAGPPTDGWSAGSPIFLNGILYGVSAAGGSGGGGVLFSIRPDGGDYRILHSFPGSLTDGSIPIKLVDVGGGIFYGITSGGGVLGRGTIFSIHHDGTFYRKVYEFLGETSVLPIPDGDSPIDLIYSHGKLFGTTMSGGANYQGEIYSVGLDGKGLRVLVTFGDRPGDPTRGAYLTDVQGSIVGTAIDGGHNDFGGIFTMNVDGSDYRFIANFGDFPLFGGGGNPGLLLEPDGLLYGTTGGGGAGFGTIFAIPPGGLIHGEGSTSALSPNATTPMPGRNP